MAAIAQRPSPSPYDPPTSALPPLPTSKIRKGLASSSASASRLPSTCSTPTSKLAIRTPTPSKGGLPLPSIRAPHTQSTPAIPTLKTTARAPSPSGKAVRRTLSIGAFPQPATSSPRSSPSSGKVSLCVGANPPGTRLKKKDSGSLSDATAPALAAPKRPRQQSSMIALHSAYSSNPSLFNGSGENVSVSTGSDHRTSSGHRTYSGHRISSGLASMPSPTRSRSSSANESYSTTATTFEDVDDVPRRGRDDARDAMDKPQSSSPAKEVRGNVIVSVRVRPDSGGEKDGESEWMVDNRTSLVSYRGREGGEYFYDNVFTTNDDNARVYDASARRLVRRVMEGYHGTVFAYGMTGTGKTFSMQGTHQSPGVIPRAIQDIFSYIRETPQREFLLRVSYLEIYNEEIRDLLSPPLNEGPGVVKAEKIKLREDNKGNVYATPLKEEIVQSTNQLLQVIARGDKARRTGSTQFNAHSSRSHAVVQIVVESRERALVDGSDKEDHRAPLPPGGVRISTLSLIDLAGSEKAAEDKNRRTEGSHINKSLLTLGTVIGRLSGERDKDGKQTDKDGKHLPYRDSKLTRLLQPALSGNSLISILCTIQIGSRTNGAAATNTSTFETLSTLKFASRAKNNIVSHAKKADEALGGAGDAGNRALLDRYRIEIQNLRTQLEGQTILQAEREEKQLEQEAQHRHEEQMLEMQLARTALRERIEHLNQLILSSRSVGVNDSRVSYSSLSMHPRLASTYAASEAGARSTRSSASYATLQNSPSVASGYTIGYHLATLRSPPLGFDSSPTSPDGPDNPVYGRSEGTASLHAQNRALQSDLADKNRYIATLEKRLLEARRSSQNRASAPSSPVLSNSEREAEIMGLQSQLEERDRTVAQLQAANRTLTGSLLLVSPAHGPTSTAVEPPRLKHMPSDTFSESNSADLSPVKLLSSALPYTASKPEGAAQARRANRKSVDEMSKMLDEMIQDRVEKGELLKGRNGSVRAANERRQASLGNVPAVTALAARLAHA